MRKTLMSEECPSYCLCEPISLYLSGLYLSAELVSQKLFFLGCKSQEIPLNETSLSCQIAQFFDMSTGQSFSAYSCILVTLWVTQVLKELNRNLAL